MAVIDARGLRKRFGQTLALDNVDFRVEEGRIHGLIGLNGAGKTTLLNAVLGLTPCEGDLTVVGRKPWTERDALMRDVCFIADVAVLPRWMRVVNALDYVAGVHPRFDRAKAERFLARTDIPLKKRIGKLSKGMVTQLHLALVMSIDAKLLVSTSRRSASTSSSASSSTTRCWATTSTASARSSSPRTRWTRSSTSSPTSRSSIEAASCSTRRWRTSSRGTRS
jgi:ABC-type glutathione transport system ATPase component